MPSVFRVLTLVLLLAGPSGTALAQSAASDTPAEPAPMAAPQQSQSADIESGEVQPSQESGTNDTGASDVSETVEVIEEESVLPSDLSVWQMFAHADWVVKAVMIGLVLASVLTWTVALAKVLELRKARARTLDNLFKLREASALAQGLNSLRGAEGTVSAIAQCAEQEIKNSEGLSKEGVKERLAWRLERIESASARSMNVGTGVLATIGSTAPFIGLFGTVWGIMNSFIGIAESNTTSLAVVAPGIAEALLATALGLVAAIPAVMLYNHFARSITSYRALVGDAATEVLSLVSHELDRKEAGKSGARAAE